MALLFTPGSELPFDTIFTPSFRSISSSLCFKGGTPPGLISYIILNASGNGLEASCRSQYSNSSVNVTLHQIDSNTTWDFCSLLRGLEVRILPFIVIPCGRHLGLSPLISHTTPLPPPSSTKETKKQNIRLCCSIVVKGGSVT